MTFGHTNRQTAPYLIPLMLSLRSVSCLIHVHPLQYLEKELGMSIDRSRLVSIITMI